MEGAAKARPGKSGGARDAHLLVLYGLTAVSIAKKKSRLGALGGQFVSAGEGNWRFFEAVGAWVSLNTETRRQTGAYGVAGAATVVETKTTGTSCTPPADAAGSACQRPIIRPPTKTRPLGRGSEGSALTRIAWRTP